MHLAPILPDGDSLRARPFVQDPRRFLNIQILSDLRFEDSPCPQPILADGADVVIVAGDTCSGGDKTFAHLRAAIPLPTPLPTPILTVLGNAAFHGRVLIEEARNARRLAPDYGIHLLDDSKAVVGGVRFVGGTMWAGYDLHGQERQVDDIWAAMAGVADHRRILIADEPSPKPLTPRHGLTLFQASTAYIATQLGRPWDGPTVVVTHHAPSGLSLLPAQRHGPLAPAYASRLGAMVACGGAALCVHGHVHATCDYRLGNTRIVCNPRGRGTGNPQFDPAFVIEVARRCPLRKASLSAQVGGGPPKPLAGRVSGALEANPPRSGNAWRRPLPPGRSGAVSEETRSSQGAGRWWTEPPRTGQSGSGQTLRRNVGTGHRPRRAAATPQAPPNPATHLSALRL